MTVTDEAKYFTVCDTSLVCTPRTMRFVAPEWRHIDSSCALTAVGGNLSTYLRCISFVAASAVTWTIWAHWLQSQSACCSRTCWCHYGPMCAGKGCRVCGFWRFARARRLPVVRTAGGQGRHPLFHRQPRVLNRYADVACAREGNLLLQSTGRSDRGRCF